MSHGPTDPFDIVFMGVGHPHAGGWARAMAAVPGVRLLGAYDPDRERGNAFIREHGGRWYEPEQVASGDVAAVVVDGRNDEVTELALRGLRLGLPVFLEKPGGMNAAELQQITDVANQADRVVQMGYFLRYADSVVETKRIVDAGELGTISLARIHAAMPRRAWDEMAAWFRDPSNIAGMFQEDACHIVDIALHLFGQPDAVSALRAVGAFAASMREDALVAILTYGTHLVSLDFTAQEANPWVQNWGIEIYGTDATLRGGFRPSWLERYDEGAFWRPVIANRPTSLQESERRGAVDDSAQYGRAAAAFVAAVRGEAPSPIDAAAGLSVFRAVEAISASADSGARVALASHDASGPIQGQAPVR